jgi:Flp pilus assembly protein TadD
MLLRVIVFSLVAMLVPADLVAQDPPEYSLAIQLVQQQHWAEALDHIQNLRKQYPGNPKVGNLEGLALLGSGDSNRAAMACQQVLVTRPDFLPALKNLAVLEWQTKKPLAAQHTEQALKIEPKDPVLNSYAALTDLKGKNVAAANQHLELAGNAISSMPPEIEMRLAYLLGTNGLYAQAARVYQDIAARGGRSSTLTYNLALAQYLTGNYENAILTLEKAQSRGHSLDDLNLLAQAYEKNHQTQQAIDRLREAITLFPGDENSYLDLATICIDHNSYPLGIEIVQLGLKDKP